MSASNGAFFGRLFKKGRRGGLGGGGFKHGLALHDVQQGLLHDARGGVRLAAEAVLALEPGRLVRLERPGRLVEVGAAVEGQVGRAEDGVTRHWRGRGRRRRGVAVVGEGLLLLLVLGGREELGVGDGGLGHDLPVGG